MLEQPLLSGAREWGCLSKPSLPPSSHCALHPLTTPHHDSPWHLKTFSVLSRPPVAFALLLPVPGLHLHSHLPADSGCLGWSGHPLSVGGWREWAGCGGGWTVAIGDGNRCIPVEAAVANSGLCGLRQNANYFQLGDCSDSCSEQGLLSWLRNLPPLLAGFGYLHF